MEKKSIKLTVSSCEECISEYVCRFREGKTISEAMLIERVKELPTGVLKIDATCKHFNAMPKFGFATVTEAVSTLKNKDENKDGGKTCTANIYNTGDVAKMTKDIKISLIGRMDV